MPNSFSVFSQLLHYFVRNGQMSSTFQASVSFAVRSKLFGIATLKSKYGSASLLLLCLTLCLPLNGQADKGNPAGATGLDLTAQFDLMVEESNRYQQFKVVPSKWLAAYKLNLADSLAIRTDRAEALQDEIDALENEVADQAKQITERDATIVTLNEEKDGISFLGNNMSKTVYNTLVWGLVAALLAGLLFFLARGRYAVSVSRELESSNAELTAELEKSKRRRLEVEQDLRRKLQDERNKNGRS